MKAIIKTLWHSKFVSNRCSSKYINILKARETSSNTTDGWDYRANGISN